MEWKRYLLPSRLLISQFSGAMLMGTEQRTRSCTHFQCFELKHWSLSSGEVQFTWSGLRHMTCLIFSHIPEFLVLCMWPWTRYLGCLMFSNSLITQIRSQMQSLAFYNNSMLAHPRWSSNSSIFKMSPFFKKICIFIFLYYSLNVVLIVLLSVT